MIFFIFKRPPSGPGQHQREMEEKVERSQMAAKLNLTGV
jgi:hypothetical protein